MAACLARRLLLVVCLCAAQVVACAAEVRRVEMPFGTLSRPEQWFPVMVQVENRERPTTKDVELVGSGSGRRTRYYTRLEMPSPSSKRVFLYGIYDEDATYRIVGAPGRGLEIIALNANDLVLGVVAKEEGGLSYLATPLQGAGRAPIDIGRFSGPRWVSQGTGTTHVRYADPARLPDRWIGYEALQALVLLDYSPREIGEKTAEAIRQWVAAGGTLVVVGGAKWQRLRADFLKELLPIEATGSQVLNAAPSLAARYGPFPMREPLLITTARRTRGAVLAQEGGIPLLVRCEYGAGQVVYLGFDPALPPFSSWNRSDRLWRDVIAWSQNTHRFVEPAFDDSAWRRGYGGPVYGGGSGPSRSLITAMAEDRQEMKAPPFGMIGLFLVAYVVCLVPVNYLVLKRIDRLEWAWLTTPAIVLAFSLTSYGVGYSLKGGALLLSRINIVQTSAGQRLGRADSFLGVFSPGKQPYTLKPTLTGGTCADLPAQQRGGPSSTLVLNEDQTFRVEDAEINMWTMRQFHSQAVLDLEGGINATVSVKDQSSKTQVTNGSRFNFEDSWIKTSHGFAPLGRLPRGQTATVASLSQQSEPFTGISNSSLAHAALEAVGLRTNVSADFGEDGLIFMGWAQDAAETIVVENARPHGANGRTLVIVRMPLSPASGERVHWTKLPARVIACRTSAPMEVNPQGERILADGSMTFELKLPTGYLRILPESLALTVSHNGSSAATASVYSFAQDRWVPLPISPGRASSTPLSSPAQYIRQPDGVVHLRFECNGARQVPIREITGSFQGKVL